MRTGKGVEMSDSKLMELEAEIIGKIAKEENNLTEQLGHNQSFCRGYLEGLEWVSEKLRQIRAGGGY